MVSGQLLTHMIHDASHTSEPVVAEVISPPASASTLRFGLRTLMAVTAVASLQFALMSYLGVFAGLLVGGVVCLAGFSLVLLVGMLMHHSAQAKQVRLLDRIVVWLMLAFVAIVIGTMLAGGGTIVVQAIERGQDEAWLRTQVGLSVQRAFVSNGADSQTVLEIVAVFPGSPADAAGVKRGDYLVNFESPSELLQDLERSRGKTLALEIGADVNNLPGMLQQQTRTISLAVP